MTDKRDLFDEVVHYIAYQTRSDPRFGRTLLAKTLFWADFTAYEEDGAPLTGARYYHWPKGPFTTEIYRAEERLEGRGVATLKPPEHEYDEAKLSAQSFEPRLTAAWHRAYLDIKIKEIRGQGTAGAVSRKSHEHPGWLVTRDKQEIPYDAAHISRTGPTNEDMAAAEEVARKFGWV